MIFRFRDELREGEDVEVALTQTVTPTQSITAYIPVMIFAFRYGLSMDPWRSASRRGSSSTPPSSGRCSMPALMKLFGDANWWMPNWTRILLRLPDREPAPRIAAESA